MRLYWLLVTHRKSGLVALTHENHKRKTLKGNIYGQNCCLVFHISGKICWIHISCPGVFMSLLSISFNIPDHQHHYWEMAGCLLPLCVPGSQNIISINVSGRNLDLKIIKWNVTTSYFRISSISQLIDFFKKYLDCKNSWFSKTGILKFLLPLFYLALYLDIFSLPRHVITIVFSSTL